MNNFLYVEILLLFHFHLKIENLLFKKDKFAQLPLCDNRTAYVSDEINDE
jgi:hypothetical protein